MKIAQRLLVVRPVDLAELVVHGDGVADHALMLRLHTVRLDGDDQRFIRRFVGLDASGKRVRIQDVSFVNEVPRFNEHLAEAQLRMKCDGVVPAPVEGLVHEGVVRQDQIVMRVADHSHPNDFLSVSA